MLLNVVYLLVGLVALPWVAWRKLSGGRPVAAPWQRFVGRVELEPPQPGVPRIWLHGVSVGEVQLLASLAGELNRQAEAAGRRIECVISSSTTTGLDVAARRFGADRSFPCPLDFSWAVSRVFGCVAPDVLVLGELELWPNLLAAADRRGIPVIVANARMSERSFRGYSRIRPLVGRMLGRITVVSSRSREDAERFTALGAGDVRVSGSMKFDGVRGDRDAPEVRRLRELAGFTAGDIVFLAGSTQAPEERLAAEAFLAVRDEHPALRLVIVPRHAERVAEVAAILDGLGLCWQARSGLETDGPDPIARVLLVDTTGELGWWWGTAAIAFVGGSLDGSRGGQNMLEPAAYGTAVSFGPHTRNFRDEVARLLAADAAVVVPDGPGLTAFVARCLAEPAWAARLGHRAAAVVAGQRGATAATARVVLDQVPEVSRDPVKE
ncbi:MAG: 3-deoxy-D-manno-octulosonic acid transferase [Planctomycetota bacterium]|nr:3-deoxy-D-manno-octulosonic acid transferase [Planctomycetota bacterium]MDA1200666.1 3-deoxy-D-manno-octulosonic acid transferase [Planctomycetota bacterium]